MIETRLRDTLSDPAEIEAAIREEAAKWARGFDANSLLILARALRSFDVTAQLDRIKAKVALCSATGFRRCRQTRCPR